MKTFKPYILSLLSLISAFPVGAMQVAPKQVQGQSVSEMYLLNIIEKEASALAAEITASLRKVLNGEPKQVYVINADQRLAKFINLLPDSMLGFKRTMIVFLSNVNSYDRARDRKTAIEHVKAVNESCKEIKEYMQKVRQTEVPGQSIQVQTIVSNEQLLDELARALHADVEKVVNFDVRSHKVPGALKLTEGLKPFVNLLTGDLASIKESLKLYIDIAQQFDNASDTEKMELLSRAVEVLSDDIALCREYLAARAEEKKLAQKPALKSALVKDGAQRKPKRTVNFNNDVQVNEVANWIKTAWPEEKEPACLAPANIPAPVAQSPVAHATSAASIMITDEKGNALSEPALIQATQPQPTKTLRRKRVKSGYSSKDTRDMIVGLSMLATPVAAAGIAAAYNAANNAGYIPTVNVAPIAQAVSSVASKSAQALMPASQAFSSFITNSANMVSNQLVVAGNAINRGLGKFGISQMGTPFQTGVTAAAVAGLSTTGGMYGVYRMFAKSAQPRSQAQITHSAPAAQSLASDASIIIADENGNVLPEPQDNKPKEKKNHKNRSYITVGGVKTAATAAALAGLGYAAYNYFMPQTAASVAPAIAIPVSVPSLPIMQASMMPTASITSAVTPLMAPAGNAFMGQGVYPWLAGSATNLFS